MNKDKAIIRLLGLESISYLIAQTDKGEIKKVLRKNDQDYHYSLDSVPLDKEKTEELLKLL